MLRSVFGWLDRVFGRGSYHPLRRLLDPSREYTQITYARTVTALATPSTRWLDAGCGHTLFSAWSAIAEHAFLPTVKLVVGCDISLPALVRHRSLSHRAASTLQELPFKSGAFDLVTLNMVAEHLLDPQVVFAEASRVLDVNGHLILHTPNADSYFVWLMRLGRRILPRDLLSRLILYLEGRSPKDVFVTHYHANTRSDLERLAKYNGLREDTFLELPDRPLFYFFLPLSALELVATKLLLHVGLRRYAANTILAVYRRI
jgi:SAM-dependent methyltransferase